MIEKYNMNINKRVKELRRKNGYTQEKIAELLGKKTSTYSQMERAGKIPINIIIRLSEIFKVGISEILYGDETANNEVPKVEETLIIDDTDKKKIAIENPPIPLEDSYERISLSNREENLIKMLNNLYPADREEVYKLVMIFHNKKFKKEVNFEMRIKDWLKELLQQ